MCSCKAKKSVSIISVTYTGADTEQLLINGRSYGAVDNGQVIRIRSDDFVSSVMVK